MQRGHPPHAPVGMLVSLIRAFGPELVAENEKALERQ
jgi:hypothetical protein